MLGLILTDHVTDAVSVPTVLLITKLTPGVIVPTESVPEPGATVHVRVMTVSASTAGAGTVYVPATSALLPLTTAREVSTFIADFFEALPEYPVSELL